MWLRKRSDEQQRCGGCLHYNIDADMTGVGWYQNACAVAAELINTAEYKVNTFVLDNWLRNPDDPNQCPKYLKIESPWEVTTTPEEIPE